METVDSEQLYAIDTLMKENTQSEKKPMVMIVHHNLETRTVFINGKEYKLETHLGANNPLYQSSSLGQKKTFYVWDKMFSLMLLTIGPIYFYGKSRSLSTACAHLALPLGDGIP